MYRSRESNSSTANAWLNVPTPGAKARWRRCGTTIRTPVSPAGPSYFLSSHWCDLSNTLLLFPDRGPPARQLCKGTHTDHRPYACPLCLADFKWQSSLKSHMRSHERKDRRVVSAAERVSFHLDPCRLENALPPVHTPASPAARRRRPVHPYVSSSHASRTAPPSTQRSVLPRQSRRGHAVSAHPRDEKTSSSRKRAVRKNWATTLRQGWIAWVSAVYRIFRVGRNSEMKKEQAERRGWNQWAVISVGFFSIFASITKQ